ncbi:MAG: hypothetical protein JRH20_29760, partial [Deltaproteobacteria bacterium]|nr:hypothetical protein [Deltaproteobacteria bacterium]
KGSFTSDVYLEDITHTLRRGFFRSITVSRFDPETAYVASWDGYVFKTTDGGKTWDESRLIVERRAYYGDVWERLYFGVHRSPGSPTPAGMGPRHYTIHSTKLGAKATARHTKFSRLRSPSGRGLTAPRMTFRRTPIGRPKVSIGTLGRAGAADNVNFGIGLPGRAPRLQYVVRKFNKPTAGLNIKQTLLQYGYLPTEVRIVVEHPNNPKVLFACTMYGLFMTYDGGLNWMRTFQGVNIRGRMIFHAAVDPEDDQKVLLATGNGVYISEDGGKNYLKATQQGVGEGVMDWIYFNPYDTRYVFVGTDYGLLRSKDRGKSWEWVYFTTFPPARVVRYVHIDPHDKKRGYIATHDGVFTIDNMLTGSLEDWKRMGGMRFTSHETVKIDANPKRRGQMWAITNMKLTTPSHRTPQDTGGAFVWESLDSGKNWRVIYSGNTYGSMQWYESDRRDPALLWLVWSRSLGRMRRRQPGYKEHQLTEAELRRVQSMVQAERIPRVGDLLLAALRYVGVDADHQLHYRRRSRLKALVPKLDLGVSGYQVRDYEHLDSGIYNLLPYRKRYNRTFNFIEWRAMLQWDLSPLVFNLDTVLFGRVDRVNGEFRAIFANTLHRLYSEYRRLKLLVITRPPADLRVRLIYKLRIEELHSYIDFMSGGYLTRYAQGGQPSGLKAPWFTRWPGTGSDFPTLGGAK